MQLIWPYKNDSLCEIDSDEIEGERGGVIQKSKKLIYF